jgi:hypothetical protein
MVIIALFKLLLTEWRLLEQSLLVLHESVLHSRFKHRNDLSVQIDILIKKRFLPLHYEQLLQVLYASQFPSQVQESD